MKRSYLHAHALVSVNIDCRSIITRQYEYQGIDTLTSELSIMVMIQSSLEWYFSMDTTSSIVYRHWYYDSNTKSIDSGISIVDYKPGRLINQKEWNRLM